jgi:hypothetical protein
MDGIYSTHGTDEKCIQKHFYVGKPEGRDNMEDLGVDGKIMSVYILEIHGKKLWTGRLLRSQ